MRIAVVVLLVVDAAFGWQLDFKGNGNFTIFNPEVFDELLTVDEH